MAGLARIPHQRASLAHSMATVFRRVSLAKEALKGTHNAAPRAVLKTTIKTPVKAGQAKKALKRVPRAELKAGLKMAIKANQIKAALAKEARDQKTLKGIRKVGPRESLKVKVEVAQVKRAQAKAALAKGASAKVVVAMRVRVGWVRVPKAVISQAQAKKAPAQVVFLAKVAQVKKVRAIKSCPVVIRLYHPNQSLAMHLQKAAQALRKEQAVSEALAATALKEIKVG